MTLNKLYPLLGAALFAQQGLAGIPPIDPPPPGLPLEMGGIAAVAALSLIIATQLIKRRK
jgi:hypothetical protein